MARQFEDGQFAGLLNLLYQGEPPDVDIQWYESAINGAIGEKKKEWNVVVQKAPNPHSPQAAVRHTLSIDLRPEGPFTDKEVKDVLKHVCTELTVIRPEPSGRAFSPTISLKGRILSDDKPVWIRLP